MKRVVLLFSFVAIFALCANAQTLINFHEMPIVGTPTPLPDLFPGNINLQWDGFYYVTPGLWQGAGAGFWVDPSQRHNTVAFIGGPLCPLSTPCSGSIKMNSILLRPQNFSFRPVSMTASAGWATNKVTVLAYNSGNFVGSVVWNLTTTPQTFNFPATWRVTQLVFTPGVVNSKELNPVNSGNGSLVIYTFLVM